MSAPAAPGLASRPPRIVRVDDVAPSPWRNGGGVTRELLAWPSPAHWRVRVSVADIGRDGPFSRFPGVERWFAVLDGAGVVLDLDGAPRTLRRGDAPLRFDGAAAPACRLVDGPTRDLNVMLRGARGAVRPVRRGAPDRSPGGAGGLFTAVAGRCAWSRAGADGTDGVDGVDGVDGATDMTDATDATDARGGNDAPGAADLPPHALLWFDARPDVLSFDAGPHTGPLLGWWIDASPLDGAGPGAVSGAVAGDDPSGRSCLPPDPGAATPARP